MAGRDVVYVPCSSQRASDTRYAAIFTFCVECVTQTYEVLYFLKKPQKVRRACGTSAKRVVLICGETVV